ncbi:ferrous iron transporter B [Bdellovibrio sp. SKB1291214]|uniref:ferrous iron transporter B n=1 Tax=Bdellovibrio sp. SKB1291214 TaxID=1732569 RepID=UPI000B65CADB|nr:ferrous iron transporter B [Bdellovibrio sp. SKB1291214]UYL08013.1 ferrous iron transporter B [Bdellovibrio sp. SKB1291214]
MCPSDVEIVNVAAAGNEERVIALVGAPNSGKTTLYNWLTGSRFKTVNYPGATVEYSLGRLAPHLGTGIQAMDTPGTYSLHPKSADEVVTIKSIYENPEFGEATGIVVVIDGTQLSRHLQLALQVKETGFPMIVVITMADLLRREGIEIDMDYLRKTLNCPVVQFDGLLAGGLLEIVAEAQKIPLDSFPKRPRVWDFDELDLKMKECDRIAKEALSHKTDHPEVRLKKIVATTEKIDRLLLHPILGLVMFLVIMGALFSSIFWLAAPFMDYVDQGFSFLNKVVGDLGPGTLWADFLANGVVSSFGAVLVFVPQIFILFFGIGLLESSGYLARAATLIDRPFSALGMSGRSFVPILSGFACAVPAIIATRNISSSRDRWITSFVIPLMQCSARLPVYALLIAFLFHGESAVMAGIVFASLYLGSLFVGGLAAGIVNKFLPHNDNSFFMMELPIYRKPKLRVLLRQSLTRTMNYVKRAGPMIFVFAVIIWVGTNFPNYNIENPHDKLEQSYAGQLGKVIEPVVAPMGVDWRVGVGLISAFAAREVFVSSLAVTFNIADDNEDTQQQSLLAQMSTAVNQHGEKVFTMSSVIGLMIFFMIALQCMTTVAIQAKESGSIKMALGQLVAFNVFAYVLVVIVVQGLRALGVS